MGQYQVDINYEKIYPMGLTKTADGIHVSVACPARTCCLLLFRQTAGGSRKGKDKEILRIPFPEEGRTGDVWEMMVRGLETEACEYAFEADGVRFSDPCGRSFCGRGQWGKLDQFRTLLKRDRKSVV